MSVSEYIATKAFAITKSDTASNVCTYIYVGGAGNVAVVTEAGDTVTYNSVAAGSFLWVRTSKVLSTNTTATNMIGHL